jgi:AraC-like DNA-binding protein
MRERLNIAVGGKGFARHFRQPSSRLAAHNHDELELNLVLAGSAAYLCGDRRVPLRVCSMIWLFPAQEHVLIDWSPDFSMWVVVFSPSLVKHHSRGGGRNILRALNTSEIFCREIDSDSVDLLSHIYDGILRQEKDIEFMNAALGYGLVASWQAYELSDELMPRTDVHTAVAKAARLISKADTPISLKQLSRSVGLSTQRLSRLFKQQIGLSLTLFRQRKCIKQFIRLYRSGARYSLIEAAMLAGFGSYPQFHRVFRNTMGMSPSAYKRSLMATTRTVRF